MTNNDPGAPLTSRRDALKTMSGVALGAATFWGAAAVASDNIAGATELPLAASVPTTIAVTVNTVKLTGVTDVSSVARSVAVVQSTGGSSFPTLRVLVPHHRSA